MSGSPPRYSEKRGFGPSFLSGNAFFPPLTSMSHQGTNEKPRPGRGRPSWLPGNAKMAGATRRARARACCPPACYRRGKGLPAKACIPAKPESVH